MTKHIILFPIYAILAFFVLLACYMFLWFIPYDLFMNHGWFGVFSYIGSVLFFIWFTIAVAYLSKPEDQ